MYTDNSVCVLKPKGHLATRSKFSPIDYSGAGSKSLTQK